jgi:hypothetical protein
MFSPPGSKKTVGVAHPGHAAATTVKCANRVWASGTCSARNAVTCCSELLRISTALRLDVAEVLTLVLTIPASPVLGPASPLPMEWTSDLAGDQSAIFTAAALLQLRDLLDLR